MDDAAIRETVDYIAVRRLQNAYADIVTRRAWGELADIFLPDAAVTIDRRTLEPIVLQGPDTIGEFIEHAIAGLDFFEFVVLNTRVFLRHGGDDDRAVTRLYMSELRHDRSSGRWQTVYGVYHDQHRRVDGRWWFGDRRYHSLARSARDFDTFVFPDGTLW